MENHKLVDLVDVSAKVTELGFSIKHLTRNLRKAGYMLHKIRRPSGRSGYAIMAQDAQDYLASLKTVVPENKVQQPVRNVEEEVRQQRENNGWISLRLSSAGMPDLINLKPRGDGSFDVLFEEVKGPGDGIRKEQYAVLEFLEQNNVPSKVTWV